jgi:hypothetical protein
MLSLSLPSSAHMLTAPSHPLVLCTVAHPPAELSHHCTVHSRTPASGSPVTTITNRDCKATVHALTDVRHVLCADLKLTAHVLNMKCSASQVRSHITLACACTEQTFNVFFYRDSLTFVVRAWPLALVVYKPCGSKSCYGLYSILPTALV